MTKKPIGTFLFLVILGVFFRTEENWEETLLFDEKKCDKRRGKNLWYEEMEKKKDFNKWREIFWYFWLNCFEWSVCSKYINYRSCLEFIQWYLRITGEKLSIIKNY